VNWREGRCADGICALWGVVAVTGSYQVRPAPSWPKIIATTARLWLQRRVLRVADGLDASKLARRRVLLAGLSVLVVAAAGVVLAEQPWAHNTASRPRLIERALAAAATNRTHAAAWIAAEVSHGVIVACDPLMCAALQHDGFPASDLDALAVGAADPLGSGLVVSTVSLRSELGTRLTTVYAPIVVASFGRGQNVVDVRVTAPDGAAAYLAAVHTDLLARQQDGQQLLHNPNVYLPADCQADLAGGHVDSRLLITLAALAHNVPVHVRQFGDAGPGAPTGTALRSMTISGAVLLPHHASYLSVVLAFLHAQRAPFLATATVSGTGAATVLTIAFTAPSPLGLLSAQPPS